MLTAATPEAPPRRRGRPRLKTKSIAELEKKGALYVVLEDDEYEEDEEVEEKRRGGEEIRESFEWDGMTYESEDPVMVVPEEDDEPVPYVGIIKSIRQAADGEMFVTLRWLYRPEKTNLKEDPRWLSCDPRELFLTDHIVEVSADMIMYKCVVHFLPSQKQLPVRKVHPGFVVQHFYDHLKQRVFRITHEAHWCKGPLWKEISSRMRETDLRIGYVPDIDNDKAAAYPKGFKTTEPQIGEGTLSPDKQGLERLDGHLSTQQRKITTPKSHKKSPYMSILSTFGTLRNDTRRDRNLEKLLEAIQSQWDFISSWHDDEVRSEYLKPIFSTMGTSRTSRSGHSDKQGQGIDLKWPDSVIIPIFSLEKEADILYEGDTHKYNRKMRQLVFNLKNNGVLAKRFVTKELQPLALLTMSPDELKAGLTAEELPRTDSDDKQEMQMVDAHCKRCSEKKIVLLGVIQAGSKERYELECSECGNKWFDSSK